ncbi:hypothetical protein RIF29_40327 [Crotalaria pallida]|uniref:Peptidase C1A papain C-terminal domain-containing protein n=1 Tax=Crotalaria pallida TaxID=3830 RepID=A0AAN9E3P6_CROPI
MPTWQLLPVTISYRRDGCCYAFAVCAALEAVVHSLYRTVVEFSPQDIYDNLINNPQEDEDGRSVEDAFEWMRVNGVVLEAVYPYVGRLQQATPITRPPLHKIYDGPADPAALKKGKVKHAMLIVGCATRYIDGRQRYYWLVRNSHGQHWADKGYCRIDSQFQLRLGQYLVEHAVGLDVDQNACIYKCYKLESFSMLFYSDTAWLANIAI